MIKRNTYIGGISFQKILNYSKKCEHIKTRESTCNQQQNNGNSYAKINIQANKNIKQKELMKQTKMYKPSPNSRQ